MEDLVSGQEFTRQPKNLPAMWLVDKVLIRVSPRSFHANLELVTSDSWPCRPARVAVMTNPASVTQYK